jgi:hypothetical protein
MKSKSKYQITDFFSLLIVGLLLSSCYSNEYFKKYPRSTSKYLQKSVRNDKEVFVLERWDAITFNQSSVLLFSDSTFTIEKSHYHKEVFYKKNDLSEDKDILIRHAKGDFKVDTTIERHCEDCDLYLIYKIYESTSDEIVVDTLYLGEFP